MAANKKSFVLYCDLIHTVKKLPKDKVADLFLHILAYVNDENPKTDDILIDLVFEPIKQQLKRDLKKWEFISEKRKKAGQKGGIKSGVSRKQNEANEANEANASLSKQNEANEAVNVNVNVNDNVTDNVINNNIPLNPPKGKKIDVFPFDEFWEIYDKKRGRKRCLLKWPKISDSDKILIKNNLSKYIESTPDPQYRKDPYTYLNGECWNDEVKSLNGKPQHLTSTPIEQIYNVPNEW